MTERDFAPLTPRPDGTIRRALATDSPATTSAEGIDRAFAETAAGPDWQNLIDRIVDALEDRVMRELERRGGRFMGEF